VIAVVALAAAAVPGSLESLALDREALAAGQIWRLATGHLVHGSIYHLGLDLAAWVLAGLLFEPILGRRYWTVLAVSAAFIDAGFLLLQPDLAAYCGLSGVLNGIATLFLPRTRLPANRNITINV
jgi:rhomboid family GlyGly-CTERM serine protease